MQTANYLPKLALIYLVKQLSSLRFLTLKGLNLEAPRDPSKWKLQNICPNLPKYILWNNCLCRENFRMFLKKGKNSPLSKLTSSNQNVLSEQMKPTLQRGTNSPLQPNKFLQGCWTKSGQSQPSTSFNNRQQDLPAVELLLVNVWTATPSPKDQSIGRTRPSSQFLRNHKNF